MNGLLSEDQLINAKAQGTEGPVLVRRWGRVYPFPQQNRCWSVEITKVRNVAESLYFFVLNFDICFGNNVFKRLQPACYRCRWVGAITLLLGILTLHTNLLPAFFASFLAYADLPILSAAVLVTSIWKRGQSGYKSNMPATSDSGVVGAWTSATLLEVTRWGLQCQWSWSLLFDVYCIRSRVTTILQTCLIFSGFKQAVTTSALASLRHNRPTVKALNSIKRYQQMRATCLVVSQREWRIIRLHFTVMRCNSTNSSIRMLPPTSRGADEDVKIQSSMTDS